MTGRSYLVTGGSKGLGRAVVTLLLAEGANVVACARGAEGLATLADEHAGSGPRLLTCVADVLDADRMAEVVAMTVETFGRLDGVLVNAGTGAIGDVLGTEGDVWDDQLRLKVHGVLNVVRPAVDALAADGGGRVVVVNSVTARSPDSTMAAVSAARAAVANLCLSLADALAPRGIGVVAVNLGAIVTDRQRERYAAGHFTVPFEAWCDLEARRRGVLAGRLGEVGEVAPAVAFLLSPLAAYTTATALDVAGGMSRGW